MAASGITTSAEAASGRYRTIECLHSDVLVCALRLLNGPALAATSCATSHLRSLSSDPDLWRDLCLSTWPSLCLLPSLPASYHSFSNAYPAIAATAGYGDLSSRLTSTINLFYRGIPILSRIMETDTLTLWFHMAPLRIDELDHGDHSNLTSPEELTLSSVVIDPVSEQKGRVTSRLPVPVGCHWYIRERLVRFAAVMGECVVSAVVACAGDNEQMREVADGG